MPRVVLMAKSIYVWLDQFSRGTAAIDLDQIPDEELDRLARWGVTGLWLIGLWERTRASQKIKQLARQPGRGRLGVLAGRLPHRRGPRRRSGLRRPPRAGVGARNPARQRHGPEPHGHRLALGRRASGLVPVAPGAALPRVYLHRCRPVRRPAGRCRARGPLLERSDAAVTFKRVDRATGEERYIYHGNDGTSFPWNDTAQLDYLKPEVREAVIQTILAVARQFPMIRFDAAMTLAKKHFQRLWCRSRAPAALSRRVPSTARCRGRVRAAHAGRILARGRRSGGGRGARHAAARRGVLAPRRLLRAHAGHAPRLQQRVHAHAPRRGERQLPAGHQEDPRVRSRDPQALRQLHDQPGRSDRGRAVREGRQVLRDRTLLATLPGLPMLGHGQIEGFGEKYGMEFRRATLDERARRVARRPPRARDLPAPPPAGTVRRGDDFLLYDL